MNIFEVERSCSDSVEVEMRDTIKLLKGVLSKMNDMKVDEVSDQDIDNFKDIYKTFYYIDCIYKGMPTR